MAVTPDLRRWSDLFAARTRAGVGGGIAEIIALTNDPTLIPFAGAFPDPPTFPTELAFDELDASAFQYAPTPGLASTRDVLAARIERDQGRRPDDAELLITSGGIEALELLGKSFLERGDLVVVEGPTYLGGIMAFRSFEAEVVAVPMGDDRLQVDAIRARQPQPLYPLPDHPNPPVRS